MLVVQHDAVGGTQPNTTYILCRVCSALFEFPANEALNIDLFKTDTEGYTITVLLDLYGVVSWLN